MIRTTLLCLLLSAQALLAQDLPAQFRVTGVAGNDVLNIRQGPSARTEKIGEIGPYGFNIEVLALSENGRWGKIGVPEGNGWVSMRYLARQEVDDAQAIPRPLSCFGTEPFWGMGLYIRGDELTRMGEERIDLERQSERPGEDGWRASHTAADGTAYGLVVARGLCSDGMSDRRYGWGATLNIDGPGGSETLQGCCTLDHRAGN